MKTVTIQFAHRDLGWYIPVEEGEYVEFIFEGHESEPLAEKLVDHQTIQKFLEEDFARIVSANDCPKPLFRIVIANEVSDDQFSPEGSVNIAFVTQGNLRGFSHCRNEHRVVDFAIDLIYPFFKQLIGIDTVDLLSILVENEFIVTSVENPLELDHLKSEWMQKVSLNSTGAFVHLKLTNEASLMDFEMVHTAIDECITDEFNLIFSASIGQTNEPKLIVFVPQ